MRDHAHDQASGTGQLDQGRFQSFPLQNDEHLLIAMKNTRREMMDQSQRAASASSHADR